jgi:hypothetical protein
VVVVDVRQLTLEKIHKRSEVEENKMLALRTSSVDGKIDGKEKFYHDGMEQ